MVIRDEPLPRNPGGKILKKALRQSVEWGATAAMTLAMLGEMVGREVAVTEWFAIKQERIDKFADATEDWQWIHLDRPRAQRESPYGATVAHGFL